MTSLAAEFADVGYVRVPGAFDADAAAEMLRGIWSELGRRHGADPADSGTWPDGAVRDLKSSKTSRLGLKLFGPRLREALDDLLGAGQWTEPRAPGFVLCNFPDGQTQWHLPTSHWHCDFALVGPDAPAVEPLSVVTLFVFHDDVPPRGGGTLVIRRSHKLVSQFVATLPSELPDSFDPNLRFMRHHPWLDELRHPHTKPRRTERFLTEEVEVEGVHTRVEELSGAAGDVVITHPWIFHCAAPNASDRPRIMRRSYVRRNTPTADA